MAKSMFLLGDGNLLAIGDKSAHHKMQRTINADSENLLLFIPCVLVAPAVPKLSVCYDLEEYFFLPCKWKLPCKEVQ